MKLDEFLPKYDFHEVHTVIINAPPEKVYAATKDLLPSELSPLVHLMFLIRDLPARLIGKSTLVAPLKKDTKPFLAQLLERGFILLSDTDQEIVFGAIGQFWKPAYDIKVIEPQAFLDFNRTDYIKVAANLAIQAEGDKTFLSTQTRIWAPDEKTRRNFAIYWRIIELGSDWIRVMWLNAIKRRAEKV